MRRWDWFTFALVMFNVGLMALYWYIGQPIPPLSVLYVSGVAVALSAQRAFSGGNE